MSATSTSSTSSTSPPRATATTCAKKNSETTLTHLTKRFMKMLSANSERVINLNEASARLCVAKRRIYDITNVLEGIGLLKKLSKNVTRWVDCPRDSAMAAPNHSPAPPAVVSAVTAAATTVSRLNAKQATQTADAELLALIKTYQALEEGVTELEAQIRQHLNAEGAYVTYHDIKSYFNDQIVIAVKAPPETRLEVNESLQIWMKSEHGEIEVYLCPQYGNNSASGNSNANITNNHNSAQQAPPAQLQRQNIYQVNNNSNNNSSLHLQQSQLSNSSSHHTVTQPPETTVTNTSNLIPGQQQQQSQQQSQQQQPFSSDEGRGRSTMSTTDGHYYDPTSGVSTDDQYYNNDPTLSSALSGAISEDEDPFKLVTLGSREETHYHNFQLEENYSITSLFSDELGLYS